VSDGSKHNQAQAWLPWVYGFSFAGLGALIPYLALLLQDRGITGWSLAASLAVLPFSRLLVGPLWALLADMFQAATWLLRLGALLSCGGAVLLWYSGAGGTGLVIGAMALLSVGRAPCGPVLDGLAIRSLEGQGKGAYGRVRRWGSVGFMVAALGVGWLTEYTSVGPLDAVVVVAVLFVGITMAMPSMGRVHRVAVGPALRKLSRDVHIWLVLLAAALHFSAHVGSTSFLAVHFDALGYGTAWPGVALAFGVLVEVVVMTYAREVLDRWHPASLLVMVVAVAWVRWWGMSNFTDGWVLVALQGMHGITFGVFWIASVALVSRRAPASVGTSAQGLLAAAVGGVGSALGMVGSSLIVEAGTTTDIYVAAQVVSLLALAAAVGALWTR
jgi:PPP family 3-phenylpropionic acid transporter